jgi:hypothetical protein
MGYIYMIKCNINNECYIGSSVQKNKKDRLRHHKGKYNECVSKQIIDRNDYQYIILEDILDIDKKQLRIKEQEYIDKYDCINKLRAYRSQEQKKQNNKQRRKEYYENNKEKIKEYKKQYEKNNKEYMKEYYENNIEKLKEYKKEYNKKYKKINKQKINNYQQDFRFFNKYNDVIAEYINDINKY